MFGLGLGLGFLGSNFTPKGSIFALVLLLVLRFALGLGSIFALVLRLVLRFALGLRLFLL